MKTILRALINFIVKFFTVKHGGHTTAAKVIKEVSRRNPKNPVKKAAIERRRKAKRLSMLSKPKRRAVYYHNLRSPQKMYV